VNQRLYFAACSAMLVFGIVLGLPGTVLSQPDTVAELGLTLTGRGTLISALFVGLLVGSLFSGPLVDTLGYRAALAVSTGFVAIALPLLAAARTGPLAGAALAALGVAAAGINTSANALSSDLFPAERARRLNRLGILAAVGGLLMPAATVLASPAVSWRTVAIVGAALSALLTVACLRAAPLSSTAHRSHSAFAAARVVARQPGFVWLGLALLLGGGIEAAMAGWTSSFLVATGFSASAATWSLSFHWLGLILARAVLSPRVENSKAATIVLCALLAGASVAGFVVTSSTVLLAIGPFVIGIAIGLIVPTTLALSGDRYPGNTAALFGLLLTLLQIGGIALPAAIGVVADRGGLRHGLSIIVVSCLCVAGATHLATRPRSMRLPQQG
jgi:MFS transporter, DHA1 family, multidrug resistance protein